MSGRAFVTGGHGFAGTHLVDLLRVRGEDPAVPRRAELDLLDADSVRAALRELRPSTVFHLAALASVGRSWEAPRETLDHNLLMTLSVLEAVRAEAPDAVVVLISSGEVYGPPDELPVTEEAPLRPQNPYAVAKAACDLLAGTYSDLRVVRLRPFNHAGPGQGDAYVIGSFTRQVAEAERAGRTCRLHTGNLDSARDFTDVRDIVRAYVAAAELEPGAYNVCSGRAVSVRELIDLLRGPAEVEIEVEIDPARVRAVDVPQVRGSAERLRSATGWTPEIPLERTVADALTGWRERLA